MISEQILADDYFRRQQHPEYQLTDQRMDSLWETVGKQVKDAMVDRFDIRELLAYIKKVPYKPSSYKDGGGVSTVHNAEKGVFVDEEHQRRYQQEFDRKHYEGRGELTLKKQRKRRFQSDEPLNDGYTGKPLKRDSSTHLDHVVSAKEIHDNQAVRLFMTDDERNDMATSDPNMVFTNSSLNHSKGEHDLRKWSKTKGKDGKTKGEHYGVNEEEAFKKNDEARSFVNSTIKKAKFKEVAGASHTRGMMVARSQMIGVIVYYASEIFTNEMKRYAKNWGAYNSIHERLSALKESAGRIKEAVQEKVVDLKSILKDVISAGIQGYVSGVVGTLVTALINTVATTVAKLGQVLQTGITSLVGVVKTWLTNPENLSREELVKDSVKTIGVSLSAVLGFVAEEAIKNALKPTALAPFSTAIGIVGGILVTGCLSGLIMYAVDHFTEIIAKVKDFIRITKKSSAQIKAEFEEALQKIDDAYQAVLQEIEEYYERLGRLQELAYDVLATASELLATSAKYAKASGVEDRKILKTSQQVDDYFLS